MKATITKRIFTCVPVGKAFILLLAGMFSTSFMYAQCSGNKVYACRPTACGGMECKCVPQSQLTNWLATVPDCVFHGNNHWADGFRLGQESTDAISFTAYPNPVSPGQSGTTISFSLEQTQTISIHVFDVSGRVVCVLATAEFGQGIHEIKWNADVNPGVYFLQFQSAENSKMLKLLVTK